MSLLECHDDVEILMNESHGVAGLHQNGDVAEWGELELGGRFEEWLRSVAIVRAIRDSFCETNRDIKESEDSDNKENGA